MKDNINLSPETKKFLATCFAMSGLLANDTLIASIATDMVNVPPERYKLIVEAAEGFGEALIQNLEQ